MSNSIVTIERRGMKLNQEAKAFQPFSITIETREEAINLKKALHTFPMRAKYPAPLPIIDTANTMYQLLEKATK